MPYPLGDIIKDSILRKLLYYSIMLDIIKISTDDLEDDLDGLFDLFG